MLRWILIALVAASRLWAADPFLDLHQSLARQADETLARSQFFRPAVVPQPAPASPTLAQILIQEGAPAELLAVVHVESRFNPWALSPKGARGLWQLLPETARRFGLRVDARSDERVDPER